ncbi:MAG: hypothetical protein ACKOA1_08465 [Bacteroidota bacterium]
MKNSFLFSALLVLILLSFTQQAQAVKITFGTKCHPDGNGACVGERGICLIIEIKKNPGLARQADISNVLGDDMGYADLNMVSGNQVRLDVLAQRSDVTLSDEFIIEEPVVLNSEVSADLGHAKVVLLPGVYRVDYGMLPFGSIVIPVAVR